MSFEELPTEIQCSIIRLLEPIGLISISQTSTHFRQLVNPTKKHFVERLLALESSAEYGGPTPVFRSRDNRLEPSLLDPRWSTMRWACTGCSRLLPHIYFDNHAILRLGYRKPIPSSPSANPITSWEPTARHGFSKPDRPIPKTSIKDTLADQKRMRRRYLICVTSSLDSLQRRSASLLAALQECGIVGLEGRSLADFRAMSPLETMQILDENAFSIELQRCGSRRHRRKCLECRYLLGELNPLPNGCGGTNKFPIVISRQMTFATSLDRYFPGFSQHLVHKRPSGNVPLSLIHREDADDQLWTMYMARCPSCTRWKEVREFRIGDVYQHWRPVIRSQPDRAWDRREVTDALLNALQCHACLAQAEGPEVLSAALLKWINHHIEPQLIRVAWSYNEGWAYLNSLSQDRIPKKYRAELKSILKGTPDGRMIPSHAEVELLRSRQKEWRVLWEKMKNDGEARWGDAEVDEFLQDWMGRLDMYEAHWVWLKGCSAELQEKPMALVEWALLERKGEY